MAMNPFAELARPLKVRPGDAIAEHRAAPRRRAETCKRGIPNIENPWGLSPAQCEVLRLLVEGLAAGEIADQICISCKTVGSHVQRMKEKMQVTSIMQAALLWDRHFRQSEVGLAPGTYEIRRNGATVGAVTIADQRPTLEA